ncbi:MAG TPA: PcfJ domain-containing protein [Pseudolabrys sp.]|nr:PcfJ domain-containing protein [Pseudolabrys sp.]
MRAAGDRFSAVLVEHSRCNARPRAVERFRDFKPDYCDKVEALRGYALREPEAWRCRLKSRLVERRFFELIRFVFARYSVPAHLERVWIEDVEDDFVDRVNAPNLAGGRRPGAPDLRYWYLTAAQGGSLYKTESHPYLSRQETHHFLEAPPEIASAKQALWYAIARAQTNRADAAVSVARSKIAIYSIASTFWKEVARFFARNPLPSHEMSDAADFLLVTKREDPAFSLKGLDLASLQRRIENWHLALRRNSAVCGGAWAGSALPDVDYKFGEDANRAIWRVRQIKTGNDLFREGQRMHHCVASYKSACMQGHTSIWSLTSEFPIGQLNRGVTIELTKDGRIVQCRGFANRLPYANEVVTVQRWAHEHGLIWASPER